MLHLLFDRSADAITLADAETGAFLDVNEASVRMTGAPNREALLRGGPEMISPKYQPDGTLSADKVKEVIRLAFEKGSHRFEWILNRFDGTELPVEVVLTPIRTGERPLLWSVARDISERKKAETENQNLRATLQQRIAERTAELAASEARLRTLLEHAPEAIVVFDGETGKFISGNAHACRLYGRDASELPLLTPADVSPEFQPNGRRSAELAREKMDEALRGGTPVFEWTHRQSSGKLIPAEVRLVRLPAEGQSLLCATIIDNTERIRREEALRHRNEQMQRHRDVLLELAQADKSDFEKALLKILSLSATTLGIARVSYWSLKEDNSAITCEALYLAELKTVNEKFRGTRLGATDCPAYFEALGTRLPIVAHDAVTHPATSGLAENYLKPLGITSMLDAPVWVRGEVVGVLCHEHIGPAREWLEEETDFVSALAAMVSLSLEESNRARSERLLRESEQKHRALFVATSQGVMLHDDKQFIEVNPAAVRIMRCQSASELIGKHPADFSPPTQPNGENSAAAAARHIADCMKHGSTRFEWMACDRQGNLIPIEVMLTRIEIGGKPLIQAVVMDISERKAAEEALRKSEEKFKQLYELSPLGMAQVEWDGRYVQVNSAFAKIVGRTPEEIAKLTYWDMTPREYEAGELAVLESLRRTGRFGPFEKEYIHKDGHRVPVVLHGMLATAADGSEQLWGIVEDITHRKRAEEELLKAIAREKELGQLRGNFVSMVSHEFRTPLGIIQSSAEILEDYLDQLEPAERKEHLASIRNNTRRMAGIMEEVLLIGRFDAGRMEFQPEPLDLRALARRVVDEVLSATDRRCAIELSLDDFPAVAKADERLLRPIFTNLLTNAVKYSDAGSAVKFDLMHDGANAICSVRDRGIGIPDADREWLFAAFHRGRNVGERPGTGLGLVIVKRCVDLHGGRIEVQSKLGEGTTMTVTLPVF